MVEPSIWGPHAWVFLHSITFNYPNCPKQEDKINMRNFFNNLQNILPCDKCKNNFLTHIKKRPLTDNILCSKRELIKWLIDIHNDVNKMNGKQSVSYNDAIYKILYNPQKDNTIIIVLSIIIGVLLLLLCCAVMYIKSQSS